MRLALGILCCALLAAGPRPVAADAAAGGTDTLRFTPVSGAGDESAVPADSAAWESNVRAVTPAPDEWWDAPVDEQLISGPREWPWWERQGQRFSPIADYNRVDPLRLGVSFEARDAAELSARAGARLEYATDRDRLLYGVQFEQPLPKHGRVSLGVSAVRRTDHLELQEVGDLENSLNLLLAHVDYRDYFEREGYGAYLAWRVPDFSVITLQVRSDAYRSLRARDAWSIFNGGSELRGNPAADEGELRVVRIGLERNPDTRRARSGLYHRVSFERAGSGLGGDFGYTRLLADVRGVARLAPPTTLVTRVVAGWTAAGTLPAQKLFPLGGVDGLRGHRVAEYRGDQALLAQAELSIGLGHVREAGFESSPHALAFVDLGYAWSNPGHQWDVGRQHLRADAGLGLATDADGPRFYVSRSLQESGAAAIWTVRLERPF